MSADEGANPPGGRRPRLHGVVINDPVQVLREEIAAFSKQMLAVQGERDQMLLTHERQLSSVLAALTRVGVEKEDLAAEIRRRDGANEGERGITTQRAAFTLLAEAYCALGLDTAPLRKALMRIYKDNAHPDRAADYILAPVLARAKKQRNTKKR